MHLSCLNNTKCKIISVLHFDAILRGGISVTRRQLVTLLKGHSRWEPLWCGVEGGYLDAQLTIGGPLPSSCHMRQDSLIHAGRKRVQAFPVPPVPAAIPDSFCIEPGHTVC